MKTQTMKTTIALCTALLVGSSALLAQDTTPATESAYAVTADFPFASKYVFRGVKLARASLQPSVEVAAGDFYTGVWSNIPLRNEHDGDITKEVDLYAGWTPKLTENLKADIGATLYWYPKAEASLADDSLEMFVGLNYTWGNFTPAVYVYRDFDLKTWTVQGSVGYSIPLKSLGTSLDLNVTVGAVSPKDGEAYNYYSAGVNLPYKLSDAVKLNLGLTYTENDIDQGKDPGLWGTVGVTASF
jgi:uncharacterized protein (TIGR02001 family)